MPSTGPQRKGSAVLLLSFPAEEFRSNYLDQMSRPLHGNENPGLHAVRPCQRADAERIRRHDRVRCDGSSIYAQVVVPSPSSASLLQINERSPVLAN